MYIAAGQGQTTPGDKILMSTETSCHYGHLLEVSDKSLCSLILYNFCHDFIRVYSPGAGVDYPWGQNCNVNRNLLSLRSFNTGFKHISFKSDFIHFIHDFIHVYSPEAGADNPLGTKFLCQQEHLVTLVICCKFPKNLFDV